MGVRETYRDCPHIKATEDDSTYRQEAVDQSKNKLHDKIFAMERKNCGL